MRWSVLLLVIAVLQALDSPRTVTIVRSQLSYRGTGSSKSLAVCLSTNNTARVTIRRQDSFTESGQVSVRTYEIQLTRDQRNEIFAILDREEVKRLTSLVKPDPEEPAQRYDSLLVEGEWAGVERRIGYINFRMPDGETALKKADAEQVASSQSALRGIQDWMDSLMPLISKAKSVEVPMCEAQGSAGDE